MNPKGNQPWIFIGRTETEAAAPILWPPNAKSQFIGKDPDAGKDWGQEEKGVAKERWLEGIQWKAWVWADSGRWWRTGELGVLQFSGLLQFTAVERDLVTEQQEYKGSPLSCSLGMQEVRTSPSPSSIPWHFTSLKFQAQRHAEWKTCDPDNWHLNFFTC